MILDFLNALSLTDSQISSNIKRLIGNGWNLRVTSKNVPYRQKHTHIRNILIFSSIRILGKRTRNLRLYGGYLEHWHIMSNLSLLACLIILHVFCHEFLFFSKVHFFKFL